ncbi:MAG: phospho-N-acetylmuramoyl-pentapeptide-transferase [Clostridiales bacterium]|nr:phospho-N-acetylmuramoyl-pentapeptide-transferase [Clostridiales bacterium]
MISYLLGSDADAYRYLVLLCLTCSFLLTVVLLKVLQASLPKDGGRAFAVNGALSQGKPRGAGIVFILVHILVVLVLLPVDRELIIYMIMLLAAMLSGYLDDASKTPWGEYKKGIIDFIIALVVSLTYVNFNSTKLVIAINGASITLHPAVYVVLAVILIWASINVVNCTDGVDGLSGTLAIVTLISFYVVFSRICGNLLYCAVILSFVLCLIGYLWYNASPSKLLMGDAGSRAIGLFIAILSLKSGRPLLFIPLAFVFIMDGGLGLIKVALLRFLKIRILKNTRTPLHDHARKKIGWSDTQTVYRFTIIATAICMAYLYVITAL